MTQNHHSPLVVGDELDAGTLNQVFSDLDSGITVLDGQVAGLTAELHALPTGYVTGYAVTVGATTVSIQPGAARADDDQADIRRDMGLTIDPATNGANGLDTGALGTNAWYRVYVIFNPVTELVAGLMSASSSPTLPTGFTHKRRVGWARTGATGTLTKSGCSGSGTDRRVMWYEDTMAAPFILWSSIDIGTTWTVQDCSAVAPPTSRTIFTYHQRLAAGGAIRIRANADQVRLLSGAVLGGLMADIDIDNQMFEYVAAAGAEGASMHAQGYIDDLGVS